MYFVQSAGKVFDIVSVIVLWPHPWDRPPQSFKP